MAEQSGALIGIVGVGRMGLAIVKHLIRHGYRVIANDIDDKRLADAQAAGAAIARTAAEVGKASAFVIVAVGYDNEASAVMLDKGGLLETMGKGSIVAVSSTCTPDHVKMLAARAAAKGVAVLDAPICRGAQAADDGTMLCLVGGTAADVERGKPVFSASRAYSARMSSGFLRLPLRSAVSQMPSFTNSSVGERRGCASLTIAERAPESHIARE